MSCRRCLSPEAQFQQVWDLFLQGKLSISQQFSRILADRFEFSNPQWSARFRLLEAESAAWRGMNPEVLAILSRPLQAETNAEIEIQRLSLLGLAHAHLHQFREAQQELDRAQSLCAEMDRATCGNMLRARGGLAIEQGDYKAAYEAYGQSLLVARRFHQRWEESIALMNMGGTSLHQEHYDQAIDELNSANAIAVALQAGDILSTTIGNLGWAYYGLGDAERALGLFKEAEERAIELGDTGNALGWLTTTGTVYQDIGKYSLAYQNYAQALQLAQRIDSKEDIVNSLESLMHVAIQAGNLPEAMSYLNQVAPMTGKTGNRLDVLDVMLAQAKIASARSENRRSEGLLRAVEQDPSSQISMRLGAQHELARLYESEGNFAGADAAYRTALATFEGAREQLKEESSKLPFLANATRIYDDYIHFLVQKGTPDEALLAADQSRGRTLAQGLGVSQSQPADGQMFKSTPVSPRAVSRKAEATLLFYWLGEKQSYLWAITPEATKLFPLPPAVQLAASIERYRKALTGAEDPREAANPDGQALYQMLVAPAAEILRRNPDRPVMILTDGALSLLNFETLLVKGSSPGSTGAKDGLHYWIEDATIVTAPSLSMLAAARPLRSANRRLLLMGDAISPREEYPSLPQAATEMQRIVQHFAPRDTLVFARQQATPVAYLKSDPRQFGYIHFVSHGVASRTDPLDSAIILSRANAADDSFRLYAREIMQHPIAAQLVTISACYGSGTRAYAGEGLVGLSWAFLRAGAHNTIGALWEASDEATPGLMDSLYQGIESGESPATALRNAKLTLLHSKSNFRKPLYWAPFQMYTRL